MRYFLFAILLFFITTLKAQDSIPCHCKQSFSIKYPKKAEENKISGQVVIEMDRDEQCMFSNPVVKKGLGYGCDEESLRIVRQQIEFNNNCAKKCQNKNGCTKGKILQSISFVLADE